MKHKFSPLQLIEEKCGFTGQLGVGCHHFRRLLRRFFRFIAKDHAMQVDVRNTWNSTDVSVANGRYKSPSV